MQHLEDTERDPGRNKRENAHASLTNLFLTKAGTSMQAMIIPTAMMAAAFNMLIYSSFVSKYELLIVPRPRMLKSTRMSTSKPTNSSSQFCFAFFQNPGSAR
jgi:hypothetical protein